MKRTRKRSRAFFFLPFDSEFNHQRAAIAQFETRTLAGDDEQLVAQLVKLVAPDAEEFSLSPTQKVTLIILITQAHTLVGNWQRTTNYMSHFLDAPVQIQYGRQVISIQLPKRVDEDTKWQPNRLGDGKLGLDWVLPQPTIVDDSGLIRLTIGPLAPDRLSDFLPGGLSQRQLQLLAGYLFPIDADWQLDVQPDTATVNDGFRLSAAGTTGRLGLTTTLAASLN